MRYAWTWTVKAECLDEYVKMHLNPWPEILTEHSRAGIRNYSIFQNGRQFFYCFECDDPAAAFAYLDLYAALAHTVNFKNKIVFKPIENFLEKYREKFEKIIISF